MKETLALYVIPCPPFPLPRWWGGSPPPPPRLAAGLRLQNDSRLLIYSELISPLIRALVKPQGKETPEKLIQRIRWLEEKAGGREGAAPTVRG